MAHNFPKNQEYVIDRVLSLEETKEIFHLCIDNDVPIYEDTLKKPVDEIYPYIYFSGDLICQTKSDEKKLKLTFEEFKDYIQGKGKKLYNQKMTLNSQYEAIITKGGVKVGCQEFSHDIIEKLYLLSVQAKKS